MKDTLRDIYDAVDEFFGGLGSRRITTYSAACAYYLFMSLVPVIMLLVSVLQYTPLTRDVGKSISWIASCFVTCSLP